MENEVSSVLSPFDFLPTIETVGRLISDILGLATLRFDVGERGLTISLLLDVIRFWYSAASSDP